MLSALGLEMSLLRRIALVFASLFLLGQTGFSVFGQQGFGRREFAPGALQRLEDLPASRLRGQIERLPAPAKDRAVAWLANTHFTDLDLDSLHADPEGGIFYADAFPAPAVQAASEPVVAAASVPVDPFPANLVFHSRPGAANVLYLNFAGENVTGTAWNNSVGRSSIPAVAFSSDSDFTTFSDAEQLAIKRVWQRVAEDYAPFDIDVTTERPASFDARTAHALITRNTDANGNANPASTSGGVAYVGVFGNRNYANYRPGWIYFNNLGKEESFIAEATSHEIGHNMGLSHDGRTDGAVYYNGHGSGDTSWGTLMGVGYNRNVSQWSKGEYYRANNTQDDLATIAGKVSYRADDHGNTRAAATPLIVSGLGRIDSTTPENDISNSSPANKGVLERNNDVDFFSLAAGTGPLKLTVNPWVVPSALTRGGNVDLLVELYDASGQLLLSNNGAALTYAVIDTTVSEGVYYLAVRNSGVGTPMESNPTGYTSYGSIGQYFISGTVLPSGVTIPPGAELQVTDIIQPGAGAKQFTVTYSDNVAIDVSSIDSSDLLVTGPNGYSRAATLVSVNFPSNGSPRVATYSVNPPNAVWDESANGSYTVSILPNAVKDTEGAWVAARTLGQFAVAVPRFLYHQSMDTNPGWTFEGLWEYGLPAYPAAGPASGYTGPNMVAYNLSGNYENRLAMTYATTPPIDCSTASSVTLRFRRWLRLRNADTAVIQVSTNGSSWTGVWSTSKPVSDNNWQEVQYALPGWAGGSSTVQIRWGIASGPAQNDIGWNLDDVSLLGNGTLDTAPPAAVLSIGNITSPGSPAHSFTVTYSDDAAISIATLGSTDLIVLGPDGSTNFVEFVGVDTSADGSPRTASYSIPAPHEQWDVADNGTYQVILQGGEVTDTSNNPIDETLLGTFSVAVSTSRQAIIAQPAAFGVPEGGTATFEVRLAEQPSADVSVIVVPTSGDPDVVVVSGATNTFTPANWSTPVQVVLAATTDADQENGTAIFECRSEGLAPVSIIATEEDTTVIGGDLPRITAIAPDAGSYRIEVSGTTGVPHILERSTDLNTWSPFATNTPISGTTIFTAPADQSHGFYRVVVP